MRPFIFSKKEVFEPRVLTANEVSEVAGGQDMSQVEDLGNGTSGTWYFSTDALGYRRDGMRLDD